MDTIELARISKFITTRYQTVGLDSNLCSAFNSWIISLSCPYEEKKRREGRYWYYTIKIRYAESRVLIGVGVNNLLSYAKELAIKDLVSQIYKIIPTQQMDECPKESNQGIVEQLSERQQNTIITRDNKEDVSDVESIKIPSLIGLSTTEKVVNFEAVTGRWMPLESIEINADQTFETLVKKWIFPEDFYALSSCTPNTLPMEVFVYGAYELEMRFVVNANKFHVGKVLVAIKSDPYQQNIMNDQINAYLCRPHLILDLTANNQGKIKIPFKYHRTFVRNAYVGAGTSGVRPACFVEIAMRILSPLVKGSTETTNIYIRPFYRITKANFAGMSYKVPLTRIPTVQMDFDSIFDMLRLVEKPLKQIGKTLNQDKPNDITRYTKIIPQPALNFSTGIGPCFTNPLTLNPSVLTTILKDHEFASEPKNLFEVARIWGVLNTFSWKAEAAPGDVLLDLVVRPGIKNIVKDFYSAPTPLDYVLGLLQFWSGTLEFRFDFVSNLFHQGSIIISAEFSRSKGGKDDCATFASYTKTFELGDQKSVTFTLPFIYDTVYRRTTLLPYNAYGDNPDASDDLKANATALMKDIKTRLKVCVINSLRPVAQTTNQIEVLTFIRAGQDFKAFGLVSSNYTPVRSTNRKTDNFPLDNYARTVVKQFVKNQSQPRILGKDRKDDTKFEGVVNIFGDVKLQMDNGEKEAKDQTGDFQPGSVAFNPQTSDSHLDFKDILRRPLLLCSQESVTKAVVGNVSSVFYVPVMVPSCAMCPLSDGAKNMIWSYAIERSAHVAIADMFRFWRGSMRYTIINTNNDRPLYVTYLPHSGVRMVGNRKYTNGAVTNTPIPIHGVGLQTEMLIPKVNPVLTVEIPYFTENNWTLINEDDTERNYSWRDKGDTNAGHLVLSAPAGEVTVDIWWSAGDDFQLGNFYGIPTRTNHCWRYLQDDNAPVVQMDFPEINLSDSITQVSSNFKKVLSGRNLVRTATSLIPGIGPQLVMADVATEVSNNINSLTQKSCETMTEIDKSLIDIRGDVTMITTRFAALQNVSAEILNQLLSAMQPFFSICSCKDIILDFLFDLVSSLYHRTAASIGVLFMRLFMKLLPSGLFTKLKDNILHIFKHLYSLFERSIQPTVQIDFTILEGIDCNLLLSLVLGVCGTILGVAVLPDVNSFKGLLNKFILRLTTSSGVAYFNQIINFVRSTADFFYQIIMRLCGYVDVEAFALQQLSGKSALLSKFVSESQLMLSESNTRCLVNPRFRLRYWANVMRAYQIQKILINVPTTRVAPMLTRLCHDVIKVGQEKFYDLASSPVRYEPFVLCIEGKSDVGKSSMVEKLAVSLLEAIDCHNYGNACFYVQPGSQYWSGYTGQPVIVFDEWLNLANPEMIIQQLNMLYRLKSTSIFIPEMAHLEEKRRHANPLIVIILTNNAFPNNNIDLVCNQREAIYRRRNLVLLAQKKLEFLNVPTREIDREVLAEIGHLEFYKNREVAQRNVTGKCVDYQQLEPWLCKVLQRYHAQELLNVRQRMTRMQAHFQDTSLEGSDLVDPFTLFYSAQESIPLPLVGGFLPEELLQYQVDVITKIVEEGIRVQQTQVVVPEAPDDIFVQGNLYETCKNLVTRMPYTLVTAFKWTFDQATQFIDNYVLSVNKRECCVCKEECVPYQTCRASLTTYDRVQDVNVLHFVCVNCAIQLRTLECPLCRCPDADLPIPSELLQSVGAYMAIMKCIRSGMCEVSHFLNSRGNKLIASWRMEMAFSTMMDLLVRGDKVKWQTVGEYSIATVLDGGLEYYNNVQVQMDDDVSLPDLWGDEEIRVQPQPLIEEPFPMQFNEEGFLLTRFKKSSPLTVCFHRQLLEKVQYVRYISGNWLVTLDSGETIKVVDGLCLENCVWEDEVVHRTFINEFLKLNQRTLRSKILMYVNNSSATDISEVEKILPRACKPTWLRLESYDEEITALTDWSWVDVIKSPTTITIVKVLTTLSVGLGLVVAGKKTYEMLNNYFGSSASSQAGYDQYDQDSYVRHLKGGKDVRRAKFIRSETSVQAETPLLEEVAITQALNNYFALKLTIGEKITKLLSGVGVYGYVGLLPKHYFTYLVKHKNDIIDLQIVFTQPTKGPIDYKFDIKDFNEAFDCDLVAFQLPRAAQMFKDIRSFFMTDSDLTAPLPSEGKLLLPISSQIKLPTLQNVDILGVVPETSVKDQEGGVLMAFDSLTYNYSRTGACGALLFRSRSNRPILSMHFAGVGEGSYGTGFGFFITQEMLHELDSVIVQMEIDTFENDLLPLSDASFVLGEGCVVEQIGALGKGLVPFQPVKTKLEASLIQKHFLQSDGTPVLPVVRFPTILSKKDPRYQHDCSPLIHGVYKHGRITKNFRTSSLNSVRDELWDHCFSKMKPLLLEPKKLTIDEAILGFKSVDFYDPIDLNASAGWPWNVTPNKAQKKSWIKVDEDYTKVVEIDKSILDQIDLKEKQRKAGIVPFTLFVDTLKDEKRKIDKVLSVGGTRVFCMSPVDYTIAQRQNFLHFCAAMMGAKHTVMCGVGINVLSSEWTALGKWLGAFNSQKLCEIDYSNFGPGFNAGVAQMAVDIMVKWTLENVAGTDERELRCLLYECTHSLHCANNLVYRQQAGSPSGASITVIINCLVNILYLMLAWEDTMMEYCREHKLILWELFWDSVRLIVYGDDALIAVKSEYLDLYNTCTLTKFFKRYNIVVTDATKSEVVLPAIKFDEAQFLKRKFKKHPKFSFEFIAEIDSYIVEDTVNWVWSNNTPKEAQVEQIRAALGLAYSRGPTYYQQFCNIMRKAMKLLKLTLVLPKWEEFDSMFYPQYY